MTVESLDKNKKIIINLLDFTYLLNKILCAVCIPTDFSFKNAAYVSDVRGRVNSEICSLTSMV